MKNKKRLVYAEEVEDLINGLDSLPCEEDVQMLVNSLNTVDAVEVAHGRWIVENGNIVCSVCHTGKPTICGYEMMICDGDKWVSMEKTNFCGNCGAKMDGE